ncbi:MAG: hypothetical protein R3C58_10355 [Parvularculaceae bacterium]
MKKLMILTFAAATMLTPAMASELEDKCTAYAQENGTDASGCSCLAETADDAATQELLAVASPEDIQGLSDDAKAAIAACWPNSAA